jgi:hypothetical protein
MRFGVAAGFLANNSAHGNLSCMLMVRVEYKSDNDFSMVGPRFATGPLFYSHMALRASRQSNFSSDQMENCNVLCSH